jgi:hypothetical protein
MIPPESARRIGEMPERCSRARVRSAAPKTGAPYARCAPFWPGSDTATGGSGGIMRQKGSFRPDGRGRKAKKRLHKKLDTTWNRCI